MAKVVLAVYDVHPSYVERFLNYASTRQNLGFEIQGYSDLSILTEQLKNNKINAVLISRDEACQEQSVREAKKTLTEACRDGGLIVVLLGDQQAAGFMEEGIPCVDKYQSMEMILTQIQSLLRERGLLSEAPKSHQGLCVGGIYSPSDKCSHLRTAWMLARKYQKEHPDSEKRILYINLEQFSGIRSFFDYDTQASLSDVIYYYKTCPDKLREGLIRTRGTFQGMDVLTAPADMTDLEVLGKKGWPDFLAALASAGDYPYILIDMSVCKWELIEMILEYGTLYIPAIPYSPEKMAEFRNFLKDPRWKGRLGKVLEVKFDSDRRTEKQTDRPDRFVEEYQ